MSESQEEWLTKTEIAAGKKPVCVDTKPSDDPLWLPYEDVVAKDTSDVVQDIVFPKRSVSSNHSGLKYLRDVHCAVNGKIDVYAVIESFDVHCPARQHAIKKLLCAGIRGKNDTIQDLQEARDACQRAIDMEQSRITVDQNG